MSRFLVAIVAGCVAAVLLTSCSIVAPVVPPQGLIYSQTKAPISTDFSNTPVGTKKGEASASSILGLIATGDCGIQAAALAGGIKTISHADYQFSSILFGIYTKTTVTVYGE
jgi:hypothetical protein